MIPSLLLLTALVNQAASTEVSMIGGSGPAGTLLVFLEGDVAGIRATRAFRKARLFHAKRAAEEPVAWVELLGPRGELLARRPLDLRPFNMDLGATRGKMLVQGDCVLDPRVATLVEIPDLGARLATLRILARDGNGSRLLGTVPGERLRALLRSRPGPLAPTVKTHLNNGAVKNRYDIVILGDGYQATELATFYRDVDRWIANLFGREPYRSYKLFFNVHSVFSPSKESGADHPDRTPPIYKDTVYDASYNTGGTGRCLYIKNTRQALLDAALAPDVEGRIVVFVNDLRYGGCAGKFSVSYNGTQAVEVQSHEFGHSFGGLADEYSYGKSGTYTGPEPRAANITADKTGKTKWPLWMGWNGISVYEGAGYYLKGLYRPKITCLMRALRRPLCEVCVEQLLKRCYVATSGIDAPNPPGNTITLNKTATTTVSFTNLVPGGGKVTWFVDNRVKQVGQTSFLLQGSAMSAGPHELRVEVQDLTTMVRKGVQSLLSKRGWTVQVNDSTLPEIRVLSITAPGQSRSGSSITIDTLIQNTGASSAAAFDLEHFISKDAKPTTNDVYLGSSTVPGLGVGQKTTIKRTVQIPYFVDPRSYRLAAWADRLARISENIKTNNLSSIALAVSAPGCVTALEHQGPLTYPVDASSLSLSKGGLSQFVVTAPCLRWHWALLLWTCKGTSPGIILPGGRKLPLNYDPVCTTLGLSALNVAPFHLFFARVNLAGHTYPILQIAPVPANPFSSHFAAVLFTLSLNGVSGTTNAVKLSFVK